MKKFRNRWKKVNTSKQQNNFRISLLGWLKLLVLSYTRPRGKPTTNFWLSLLRWLKLLVLSYTRPRVHPPGIYFHDPGDNLKNRTMIKIKFQNQIKNDKKISIMKSIKRHIKWGVMLL